MRRPATIAAGVLAALALLLFSAPSAAAHPNPHVGPVCEAGHPCVGNGMTGSAAKVYNGICGFQNFELASGGAFPRDAARNWRTHGNPMQLGNFVGTDPRNPDHYSWSAVLPPNSSGAIIPAPDGGSVDAMNVIC